MAPWPDKSRSSLWGPDVYLRDAHTQASGCSHVPQPRKSEARSSSDSAKRTQLNDSSSKRINLKQAPASLPRRANTAQLPVRASCIARCTCNSHCIQPLVRQCWYLRPGAVPGLTRRPQTRPCSMRCHAMQGTHRCHPHLHRNGGPQRDTATCTALQSDLHVWNPRKHKAHRTRSAAAAPS